MVQDHEVHASLLRCLGPVDEVFQRAAGPVRPGNGALVAGPDGRERNFVGFGPTGGCSRCAAEEHLSAPGRGQGVVLGLGMLIAS